MRVISTVFGKILGVSVLLLFLSGGCATRPIELGSVPEPPATGKLRVYFKVISAAEPNNGWGRSEKEVEDMYRPWITRALDESGVCDLASADDVDRVLAGWAPTSWDWLRDDKSLVRQVGKSLHADYAIIQERHWGNVISVRYLLVNVQTGDTYEAQTLTNRTDKPNENFRVSMSRTWKKLYRMARKDLLLSALRKARGEEAPPLVDAPVIMVETETEDVVEVPVSPAAGNLPTLAVYDFAADQSMQTAAIILTDALREELLRQGKVTLINRENISQVLQEMAISQMGLTDDSLAIDAGKALASSQIVSGHLGALGNSSILQVKRVEVASHITRFIGSTRCPKGNEELLFDEIAGLARDVTLGF